MVQVMEATWQIHSKWLNLSFVSDDRRGFEVGVNGGRDFPRQIADMTLLLHPEEVYKFPGMGSYVRSHISDCVSVLLKNCVVVEDFEFPVQPTLSPVNDGLEVITFPPVVVREEVVQNGEYMAFSPASLFNEKMPANRIISQMDLVYHNDFSVVPPNLNDNDVEFDGYIVSALKSLPMKLGQNKFQETTAWREFNNYVSTVTSGMHSTCKRIIDKKLGQSGPQNKLFEMLIMQVCDFGDLATHSVPGNYKALDLCSGSGGFVKVLLSSGFSVTAMDSDGVLAKNFPSQLSSRTLRLHKTSRFHLEDSDYYSLERPYKLDPVLFRDPIFELVTCDGFNDVDPALVTDRYYPHAVWEAQCSIFIEQLVAAFFSVAPGGTILIKYFHYPVAGFDYVTDLITAVSFYFASFGFVKPPSSDLVNYERYMVFRGFSFTSLLTDLKNPQIEGLASSEVIGMASKMANLYSRVTAIRYGLLLAKGCLLASIDCEGGSSCAHAGSLSLPAKNVRKALFAYDRLIKDRRSYVMVNVLDRYKKTVTKPTVSKNSIKKRKAISVVPPTPKGGERASGPFTYHTGMASSLAEFASPSMGGVLDTMTIAQYGITIAKAKAMNICIRCKKTPLSFPDQKARDEFQISALCPGCWKEVVFLSC